MDEKEFEMFEMGLWSFRWPWKRVNPPFYILAKTHACQLWYFYPHFFLVHICSASGRIPIYVSLTTAKVYSLLQESPLVYSFVYKSGYWCIPSKRNLAKDGHRTRRFGRDPHESAGHGHQCDPWIWQWLGQYRTFFRTFRIRSNVLTESHISSHLLLGYSLT